MRDKDDGQNRRRFLVNVAGASTVLAAAIADRAAAEKLAPPHPAQAVAGHGDWNLGWVDRIGRARHRVVFDSTEIAGGTALGNAFLCLRDYAAIQGATDSDMGLVVVIRHFAVPMVFGDPSWSRFKLGEIAKVKDPVTDQDAVRNPFLSVMPGTKTMLADTNGGIDSLIARGVVFLCCNEALKHFAEMVGKAAGIPGDEARRSLVASLVPGTLLVPSGIFGLARAEEAGCHYIRST
jgi:intracellular sulfur oxidation DsrE/DsrF family protein